MHDHIFYFELINQRKVFNKPILKDYEW